MMVGTERLLDTFLDLVRIPSPSGQEEAVAEAIAARLGALGIAVERDAVGNLIARVDGVGEPLLLTAHMDTVVPCEGVVPVVRGEGDARIVASAGDTILGADDKAGVAILLELLAVLAENELAHRPLELLFTVGEEKGLRGAKALDVGRFRATMGLGLDVAGVPGIMVVHAPYQDHWRAVVHGRAAHAGGNPEAGVSAIQVAAEGIAGMPLGRIDDETTANIGVIQGGRATNIIPDRVELDGEARSRDVTKLEKQIEAMSLYTIWSVDVVERWRQRLKMPRGSFRIGRMPWRLQLLVNPQRTSPQHLSAFTNHDELEHRRMLDRLHGESACLWQEVPGSRPGRVATRGSSEKNVCPPVVADARPNRTR